jgi:phosphate acetyltransferase/phosphate butyryltransferase
MDRIENRTFDELQIGDAASIARTLTNKDIELFAVMSGDVNPAHVDPEFAKSDMFHKVVAHSMWGGALISTVLGTELPGPGTIYLSQTLRFKHPVELGDTVTVSIKVAQKHPEHHRVTFDCTVTNQRGKTVIDGAADEIAPTEKISRAQYQRLIQQAKGLAAIRTAVVHPVDTVSLLGAVEAAKADIIVPVLVGPEAKIRAAAATAKIDVSPYELVGDGAQPCCSGRSRGACPRPQGGRADEREPPHRRVHGRHRRLEF